MKINSNLHIDIEINLIFTCLCIANVIPNYKQQEATFLNLFISTDSPPPETCTASVEINKLRKVAHLAGFNLELYRNNIGLFIIKYNYPVHAIKLC